MQLESGYKYLHTRSVRCSKLMRFLLDVNRLFSDRVS